MSDRTIERPPAPDNRTLKPAETDAAEPDNRHGSWAILVRDGRRVLCQCRCGTRRWLAVDALTASTSCGCAPAPELQREMREADAQRHRRRDRDWRPQR
jgi:hypothetical protein